MSDRAVATPVVAPATPANAEAPAVRASAPRGARIGVAVVCCFFAIGGIAHFAATAWMLRIVPPWVPWPRETVWATGALELLGAAGLLWPPLRRAAGIGLAVLTVAVTPANIHMLLQHQRFDVPVWLLVLRLPLQLALLGLIVWSTWPRAARRA